MSVQMVFVGQPFPSASIDLQVRTLASAVYRALEKEPGDWQVVLEPPLAAARETVRMTVSGIGFVWATSVALATSELCVRRLLKTIHMREARPGAPVTRSAQPAT